MGTDTHLTPALSPEGGEGDQSTAGYRDSPNYQEAQRRLRLQRRARTDLGRCWHHQQFIAALKAMIQEKLVAR